MQGWEARACEAIVEGSFVCTYAGELVGTAEAERRLAAYDAQHVGHALLVRYPHAPC